MTQIRFFSSEDGPHTHVLIIGVGYYEHLIGGRNPQGHSGLSVLNSPPTSALSLAQWIAGSLNNQGLNNPDAPLATMDLLISQRESTHFECNGVLHEIERATLSNVKQAFDRWYAEIRSDPNNVGVLYFCGHGCTGNTYDHYLLVEDHGASVNRPFETGSFDITNTLRSLSRNVEAQLYVFIDACRTYNRMLADTMGGHPLPLCHAGASTRNVSRGSLIFESTDDNAEAYGDSTGVSRFTTALMQALEGYCGMWHSASRSWHINTSALVQSVPALMDLLNKEYGGKPQYCSPHPSGRPDIPLHRMSQAPRVKIEIDLKPVSERSRYRFAIHDRANSSTPPITGGQVDGIWRTEAAKGIYDIRINSVPPLNNDEQYLDPPHFYLPVEVN